MKKTRVMLLVLSFCLLLASFLRASQPPLPDAERTGTAETGGADYIRWVEFTPTAAAMNDCLAYDLKTYGTPRHVGWVELLALLAARSGGSFKSYRTSDLTRLTDKLDADPSLTPGALTSNAKLYAYYLEAYGAVLGGMVGTFTEPGTDGSGEEQVFYGLRAFSPLAAGYAYTDYDDFGQARTYGYKRSHLGHDMLGGIGTPVVAIESGYVEKLGWNRYGGWRVGIRSLDGKRYYYYAHLRAGHPFCDVYEGKYVDAGSVIGYLGMTGYSGKEDVNGISVPHLHVGLQLIFDASQIDGNNQIWVDLYALTAFLSQNRAATALTADGKERTSLRICRWTEMPD